MPFWLDLSFIEPVDDDDEPASLTLIPLGTQEKPSLLVMGGQEVRSKQSPSWPAFPVDSMSNKDDFFLMLCGLSSSVPVGGAYSSTLLDVSGGTVSGSVACVCSCSWPSW